MIFYLNQGCVKTSLISTSDVVNPLFSGVEIGILFM